MRVEGNLGLLRRDFNICEINVTSRFVALLKGSAHGHKPSIDRRPRVSGGQAASMGLCCRLTFEKQRDLTELNAQLGHA